MKRAELEAIHKLIQCAINYEALRAAQESRGVYYPTKKISGLFSEYHAAYQNILALCEDEKDEA